MRPTDLSWALFAVVFAAPALAAQPALCDAYSGLPSGFAAAQGGQPNRAGLVAIAGGRFRMGSDEGYPEERSVHEVRVDAFAIDRHEVTNAQFARFVQATGYVTRAERAPEAADFPAAAADRLAPGAAVFVPPRKGEHLRGAYAWWRWMPGADWRHPAGPGSDIRGRGNHPVVQVAFEDAQAYAKWLGRELPTEAQWEYAARGGLDGATYPWGNTPETRTRPMANTWQGRFPFGDQGTDGRKGSAPVGCYAANGYGLVDVVGNAWEWTRDLYKAEHDVRAVENPMVVSLNAEGTATTAATTNAARVIKGGSFLCAPDFCVRYRPASRQPQEATLGAMHVGFRTVLNAPN
ncbi:formylglycine-generating enzyme family protein [Acidovorax cavernicola]|uniref:Formylglycine-generating enzyme family protein n=1 Tax=Acidovorax cavernicola TaxID=1675792 RepID=A0A9X8D2J8_9BURK|nr:formylglycine-generating enzyme family protein [Acidovorax cavernicola]RIX76888.1 formylglycine-generating enzyme family protein [Acidovorax cavernicola]